MDINPYEAPQVPTEEETPPEESAPEKTINLRNIAYLQKGLILSIAVYFLIPFLAFVLPIEGAHDGAIRATLLILPLGVIITFCLAKELFGIGLGIVMGLLLLVPCLGIIVMLMINSKASSVLKEHGWKVGLLGASIPKEYR